MPPPKRDRDDLEKLLNERRCLQDEVLHDLVVEHKEMRDWWLGAKAIIGLVKWIGLIAVLDFLKLLYDLGTHLTKH
jgi:hypothetical protein